MTPMQQAYNEDLYHAIRTHLKDFGVHATQLDDFTDTLTGEVTQLNLRYASIPTRPAHVRRQSRIMHPVLEDVARPGPGIRVVSGLTGKPGKPGKASASTSPKR